MVINVGPDYICHVTIIHCTKIFLEVLNIHIWFQAT